VIALHVRELESLDAAELDRLVHLVAPLLGGLNDQVRAHPDDRASCWLRDLVAVGVAALHDELRIRDAAEALDDEILGD
jgi:hypothetical protein